MAPYLRKLLTVVLAMGGLLAALVLALPGLTSFQATSARYEELSPAPHTEAERGIAYFTFGDFSALSSDTLRVSASPWKLTVAALALNQADGDPVRAGAVDIGSIFRTFGFHSPTRIANWPTTLPKPRLDDPIGQNIGYGGNPVFPVAATIGNIGCAACHSSVVYDAAGEPDTSTIWLGAPNTSINLEAYTVALFEAVRDYGGDTETLMRTVQLRFPDTDWRERLTLRYFILPELRKQFAERNASLGRLLPFRASLAGATNGLDSLKNRLGLIPQDRMVPQSVFNSVPDLGSRLWRTKFLNGGNYLIPGMDHRATLTAGDITPEHRRHLGAIIAYFTVPSMGVTPEVAEANIGHATDITAWMSEYEPQPFPGLVDRSVLSRGQAVYAQACAVCHGTYDANLERPRLTSFPNWEGDIGSDPKRYELLGPDVVDAVNGSIYNKYIAARTVKTYTAPPLTGIWASAPYLHNGSVPTLWHLMRPNQRPIRFQVGGHSLDLGKVGIAGTNDGKGGWMPSVGYVPWSTPVDIDTRAFGLGNGGHAAEFEPLSETDKAALLEYLKLL